jgi:hypothetical protein
MLSNTLIAESPRSYFARALWDQHNVIVLTGAVLFALAFASPMPLAIAAIAEALWLTIAPNLTAYRAWVDRFDTAAEREQEERDFAASPALGDAAFAARFSALSRVSEEVGDIAARRAELPAELAPIRRGLGRLRALFLDFGHTQQRLSRRAPENRADELNAELAELTQAFAVERELEARMSLRNAIQATQLEAQRQAHWLMQLKSVENKLDLIQKGASYLKAVILNAGDIDQLQHELDGLLAEIGHPPSLELRSDPAAPASAQS